MTFRTFGIALLALALGGCGAREDDQSATVNYVPPVTKAPAPMAGQKQSTPLTAHIGHYPRDAVSGVSFYDRSEVANALVDLEGDAKVRRLVVGRDATDVPIFAQDGRIAAHGCEPHNCADRHWTLLVAPDGNRDNASFCFHDAAAMGDASRWSDRRGTTRRPGPCPAA